jgi:quercetin dioxygenase-like cupin family protein
VQFFEFEDAQPLAPVPGIEVRAVFGAGASVNLVSLAAGVELSLHHHPHEQIGVVLEGALILVADGVDHRLVPRQAFVVPGGSEHAARAGPDGCLVLDVFVPAREDHRAAAAPARAPLGPEGG